MLNIAFAGFRHGHIYSLLDYARKNEKLHITGGWEEYGPDKEVAQSQWNMEFPYENYADILNDPSVDIVAIGNYYTARGQMIIDALKAGKHVIADKPICTSIEEMNQIIALQAKTGLQIFAMLDLRFNKNAIAVKKLIEEGAIGEVNNISFGGQHPLMLGSRAGWYFEEGKHGGTINDIAVHGIDLIRYFTGSDVKKIDGARCWNKFAKGVPHFEDSSMFMLTLENGAGVIADVSYATPDSIGYGLEYYWEFKIWGTEGLIVFTIYGDSVKLYKNGNKEVVLVDGIEPDMNYLDGIVDAIEGRHPRYLDTRETLASSLQTLLVQAYADDQK